MTIFLVFATLINTLFEQSLVNSKDYPANCNGLEDGIYTMQLIDDDSYPLVNIKCKDGFAILDYNFDANIKEYFTSWDYWHRATVGPSSNEIHNWHEWYVPDSGVLNTLHNYRVSPDCETCEYVSNRQLYGDQTTYWMTGTFFGCYWRVKANSNCDMDYETLDCYTCQTDDRYINDITSSNIVERINDDSSEEDYEYTGLCTHNVRPAGYYKPESQETCTTSRTDLLRDSQNLKPSLGTNGQFCVCTQPKNIEHTQYFTVADSSTTIQQIKDEDKHKHKEKNDKIRLNTNRIKSTSNKIKTPIYTSIDQMEKHMENDIIQNTFIGSKIVDTNSNSNEIENEKDDENEDEIENNTNNSDDSEEDSSKDKENSDTQRNLPDKDSDGMNVVE